MYEENVSAKTFSSKIKASPLELGKIEIVLSTPNANVRKIYSINVAMVSKINVTEIATF